MIYCASLCLLLLRLLLSVFHLAIYLYVCLPVPLSVRLPVLLSVCLSVFRSVGPRVYCVCNLKISVSAAFERIFKLLAKNRVAVKLSRPIAALSTPLCPVVVHSQATKIRFKYFGIFHQFSYNAFRLCQYELACAAQAALLPASRNVACHDINSAAQQPGSSRAALWQGIRSRHPAALPHSWLTFSIIYAAISASYFSTRPTSEFSICRTYSAFENRRAFHVARFLKIADRDFKALMIKFS